MRSSRSSPDDDAGPIAVFRFLQMGMLDFLMGTDAEDGPSPDNRTLLALASIKADVLRFGLKDPA
ncbi:MAG: hypothetical protein WAV18_24990 [Roseiarcus sp.]